MAEVVAAVTCDIVGPTRYAGAERARADAILREGFQTLARGEGEDVLASRSFSVIRGDEFRFVAKRPERSYAMVVRYRALAARVGVAYQNIQKRLKAASWEPFARGLTALEKRIEVHLERGETG